jgi:hypothetical protein
MTEKVVFPYDSLDAAAKDKYKKIGGPEQALRCLKKGYKSILWRKRADANVRATEAEQDAAFERENGPVVKKKSNGVKSVPVVKKGVKRGKAATR